MNRTKKAAAALTLAIAAVLGTAAAAAADSHATGEGAFTQSIQGNGGDVTSPQDSHATATPLEGHAS